jgi:hypothetical protein
MAAGTRLGWKKRLMPPPCHFPENESHFWRKKRFYTFFMATALLCMMKLAALTCHLSSKKQLNFKSVRVHKKVTKLFFPLCVFFFVLTHKNVVNKVLRSRNE